jgi:hypothetical protein
LGAQACRIRGRRRWLSCYPSHFPRRGATCRKHRFPSWHPRKQCKCW